MSKNISLFGALETLGDLFPTADDNVIKDTIFQANGKMARIVEILSKTFSSSTVIDMEKFKHQRIEGFVSKKKRRRSGSSLSKRLKNVEINKDFLDERKESENNKEDKTIEDRIKSRTKRVETQKKRLSLSARMHKFQNLNFNQPSYFSTGTPSSFFSSSSKKHPVGNNLHKKAVLGNNSKFANRMSLSSRMRALSYQNELLQSNRGGLRDSMESIKEKLKKSKTVMEIRKERERNKKSGKLLFSRLKAYTDKKE